MKPTWAVCQLGEGNFFLKQINKCTGEWSNTVSLKSDQDDKKQHRLYQ